MFLRDTSYIKPATFSPFFAACVLVASVLVVPLIVCIPCLLSRACISTFLQFYRIIPNKLQIESGVSDGIGSSTLSNATLYGCGQKQKENFITLFECIAVPVLTMRKLCVLGRIS